MDLTIVQKIAIWAIPLIFAITVHEVAHGWVASWFGDQTARLSGRLTLNPIPHIDPIGTIVVPLLMLVSTNFIFGWAKPVPVDQRNMRNPRRDMAITALAGPVMNLIMALIWAAIAKFGIYLEGAGHAWLGVPLSYMGGAGIMINIVLGVLNLIPLPPLDGGRVLTSVLPPRMAYQVSLVEPYAFFILIFLLITGLLGAIIGPVVFLLLNFIRALFGL